jgi:Tol biopolymer transport system component
MSSDRRFEQELPGLLDELFMGPMPAYRDFVIDRAARTSQRPAWSFLGRWLPMVDVVRQPVLAPRLPWRSIGLALVLIALFAAIVATILIGGPQKVPALFGPAENGLVAYSNNGDIYTANAVTGNSTAIVTGPETDINPRWSRDGTLVVFERKVSGNAGPGLLLVGRRDGTGLVRITPDEALISGNYEFSPDGSKVLVEVSVNNSPRVLIASTDGSGALELLARPTTNASWRPPDGSEILFMDGGDPSNGFGGIHAVDTATGVVRTIVGEEYGRYRSFPSWSPDGSRIAYVEFVDSPILTAQTHVMGADGSGDRTLPTPPGAMWQGPKAWSNDGTRLIAIRGYSGGYDQSRAVALPVDGGGFGVEIDYPTPIQRECCTAWEWAPDDSWILGTPTDASGTMLDQVQLDPINGVSREVNWNSVSQPSIQRLAP